MPQGAVCITRWIRLLLGKVVGPAFKFQTVVALGFLKKRGPQQGEACVAQRAKNVSNRRFWNLSEPLLGRQCVKTFKYVKNSFGQIWNFRIVAYICTRFQRPVRLAVQDISLSRRRSRVRIPYGSQAD